jgi:hypothetical protein
MTILSILLIIVGFVSLLYIVRKPLSELVKFIFDNFLKVIIERVGGWIEPFLRQIKNLWNSVEHKLTFSRVIASLLLTAVLALLCTVNYYLIYYGMELLLSSEEGTGALGFTPAGLFSLVLMLAELLVGFMVLESLGFTDLFEFHKLSKVKLLRILLIVLLLILIFAEVGIALYRNYQVAPAEKADTQFEKIMNKLPYGAVGALAFVIPAIIAVLGFVLRDLFLFIALVFLSIIYIPFFLLNILYIVIWNVITHIDDFLNYLIQIIVKPIEIIVNFILFILIKLKIIKPIASLLIISLLLLPSTCYSKKDQIPPRLIVVLLDNSGSFKNFRDKAIDHCLNFVDSMKGGDSFVLFLIDSESLKRDRPPHSFTIPKSKTTLITKDFKEIEDSVKEKNKNEILKIKEMKTSGYTDIWGALIRASQIINSKLYSQFQKFLLIYSDMQDTKQRGPTLPINLENVCVKIFYADINERTIKGVEFWKNKLLELKAKSLEVFTPDECEAMKDFNLKREERR